MSKHSHGNSPGTGEARGNPRESGNPVQGEGTGGANTGNTGEKPQEATAASGPDSANSGSADFSSTNFSSKLPEAKIAALEADLAEWVQKYADMEAKLADLNDQFLRKAADFENFRKRTIREKQEITDFSNQNLLLDLLPVIDDFERAIKSAETSKDFASFYEGIVMIEKRLTSDLENKWGLKRFNSLGELFDPNRHEALQMEKAAGITEAVVKDDFVKGYLLKDRVIRFAKVKVLMPETEGNAQGTGNKE